VRVGRVRERYGRKSESVCRGTVTPVVHSVLRRAFRGRREQLRLDSRQACCTPGCDSEGMRIWTTVSDGVVKGTDALFFAMPLREIEQLVSLWGVAR
jgi:hypothetical protein